MCVSKYALRVKLTWVGILLAYCTKIEVKWKEESILNSS